MKRLSARLLAALVALLVAAISQAQADFLDYGFHWSISPKGGIQGSNPGTLTGASTGSVAIAVAPDGSGSAIIPAANVTTSSTATSASPDTYNSTYNLTLHLTDNPSKTSGDLMFVGSIKGSLTATSSSLTNTFQNTLANPLTQQLTLGSHVYSVTIDPTVANLPAPGSQTPALLDAIIQVSDKGPSGPPVNDAPEPASLLLGGLGFSVMGLGCWWKRRSVIR